MIKGFIITLGLMLGFSAQANNSIVETIVQKQNVSVMAEAETLGLNWKVGDTCNYNLDMGFIKGTMEMKVREIGADGIWLDQNMDLGFMGKQQVSVLIDPNTGAIKKMIVNGKEQAPPENDVEVVEATEDHVTVPAGSFDVIHFKIHDKKQNQNMDQWVNPKAIPVSGMAKSKAPGQFGEVNIELTSFRKN